MTSARSGWLLELAKNFSIYVISHYERSGTAKRKPEFPEEKKTKIIVAFLAPTKRINFSFQNKLNFN